MLRFISCVSAGVLSWYPALISVASSGQQWPALSYLLPHCHDQLCSALCLCAELSQDSQRSGLTSPACFTIILSSWAGAAGAGVVQPTSAKAAASKIHPDIVKYFKIINYIRNRNIFPASSLHLRRPFGKQNLKNISEKIIFVLPASCWRYTPLAALHSLCGPLTHVDSLRV